MKGSGGQCAGDEQNRKKIEGGLRPPNNSFVSGFCVFFHGSKPGFRSCSTHNMGRLHTGLLRFCRTFFLQSV
jgi:hypothetical protein